MWPSGRRKSPPGGSYRNTRSILRSSPDRRVGRTSIRPRRCRLHRRSRRPRVREPAGRPLPFLCQRIAMADSASLHLDSHRSGAGIRIPRSTISRGPPGRETCTARIFDILPPRTILPQSCGTRLSLHLRFDTFNVFSHLRRFPKATAGVLYLQLMLEPNARR